MSIERAFEPWEEFHRRGQDLADRLAQGFTGLIAETLVSSSSSAAAKLDLPSAAAAGVSAICDIGNQIGQAGAELGAGLNGMVQQFFRQLPPPFRSEYPPLRAGMETRRRDDDASDFGIAASAAEAIGNHEALSKVRSEEADDEDEIVFYSRGSGRFRRARGTINITSTYDSRSQDIESSLFARGDLWRIEQGSQYRNRYRTIPMSSGIGGIGSIGGFGSEYRIFLKGMHSLCPALWSKHRRWLLMSMICFNPVTCSFMDLQFPNGQLTYADGQGLTTSAFLPVCGGLLQTQGRYPGKTKVSFSCKNRRGTHIKPMLQWPDKSFSLGLAHPIAWKRDGLMVRPSIQFSICPTIGGSNPGLRAELIHSVKEELKLICGYARNLHPSAYSLVSLGRSQWNGNVGTSGAVLRVEFPLSNIGGPFFSLQLNSGFEFDLLP